MNPLTRFYIHQAGGGGVGPIFVQRGHGLGDILSALFRTMRNLFFTSKRTAGKEAAKALGREALRTGGMSYTTELRLPGSVVFHYKVNIYCVQLQ